MNYKEIELESYGQIEKHIIIDNGDGSFKSFPANESNSEYLAFVATEIPAKKKAQKPAVEAAIVEPEVIEAE